MPDKATADGSHVCGALCNGNPTTTTKVIRCWICKRRRRMTVSHYDCYAPNAKCRTCGTVHVPKGEE